jgi:hypothetical protein
MNFCFGPMTKNVVDTIIQFSLENPDRKYSFIPSRRQIEYNGGYVNHWNTEDFTKYIKEKNNKIIIERDHGGPNQGLLEDDGFESLTEDAKILDIIHIDPWKKYYHIDEGITSTVKMINHCNSINPNLLYEICTEEAIRPFSVEEIDYIVQPIPYYNKDIAGLSMDDCYFYGVLLHGGSISKIQLANTPLSVQEYVCMYLTTRCIQYIPTFCDTGIDEITWEKTTTLPFRTSDIYNENGMIDIHYRWWWRSR